MIQASLGNHGQARPPPFRLRKLHHHLVRGLHGTNVSAVAAPLVVDAKRLADIGNRKPALTVNECAPDGSIGDCVGEECRSGGLVHRCGLSVDGFRSAGSRELSVFMVCGALVPANVRTCIYGRYRMRKNGCLPQRVMPWKALNLSKAARPFTGDVERTKPSTSPRSMQSEGQRRANTLRTALRSVRSWYEGSVFRRTWLILRATSARAFVVSFGWSLGSAAVYPNGADLYIRVR